MRITSSKIIQSLQMNYFVQTLTLHQIVGVLVVLFITSCQPSLNKPATSPYNHNLNTMMTLEIGENEIYLQDFILNVNEIDSVTCSSNSVNIQLSADKKIAKFSVAVDTEKFVDIKIYVKGVAYSIPCRKSDKTVYNFTFDAQGKNYKHIQIAGQMNDWTPSRTPELQKNEQGLYEVQLELSPGTYLYQMNLDGEQNHDPNNPQKVDNGFGKYNSILEIPGKKHLFPLLTTESHGNNKIKISVQNEVDKIFVYWQNYLLPDNFVKIANGVITFDIPVEASDLQRSYIRVWAANQYGVSNDVLIPLHKGKVLDDNKYLTRTDKYAQIIYFMLIDRFMNGNTLNDKPLNRPDVNKRVDFWGGDLAGLQQKIETGYFKKLGVNTLWISPLNQNPLEPYGFYAPKNTKFSGYHGYWPISSSKVDFRFGSNDELKTLVKQAHKHDINVLLDYVANHVHEKHPLYKQHPEFATNLYLPDGTLNVEKWDEYRLTTWFDTFMPSLDYSNPVVVNMMTDSAMFWLTEFDLDGFRHDACKHVNLEFWRLLTLKMKQKFPNKMNYQIGETYGSPKLIASYLTTGMLDGQFDFNVFDIANTTFAGVGGGNLKRVQSVLNASLQTYGTHNLMGYISGNHDKARFMAYASGDIKFGEDAKAAGWNRDIGISDSTAYDKFLLFHAFNLTIPGVPVIYYGDEIGMTGGNDPDSRRMMRFSNLNAREQILFDKVSKLAHLRRANLALVYGDFINVDNQTDMWIYARKYFENEAIVIINNSAQSRKVQSKLPDVVKAEKLKAVFGTHFEKNKRWLTLTLPAYSVEILLNEK